MPANQNEGGPVGEADWLLANQLEQLHFEQWVVPEVDVLKPNIEFQGLASETVLDNY